MDGAVFSAAITFPMTLNHSFYGTSKEHARQNMTID